MLKTSDIFTSIFAQILQNRSHRARYCKLEKNRVIV